MLKLNLTIALRNLWKNKGFTLINIGGLAIGLASCIILLLYVNNEWNYDKQFTDYQKSYVVYNNIKASGKTFSVQVTPNALPFTLAAVLSVIIAQLTVSIQSVKVAKANPIDALRSE